MKQFKTKVAVLSCPIKPKNLPLEAYWLSGEGCGSWFTIIQIQNEFVIKRYNPEGKLECEGHFIQVEGTALDLEAPYEFTYLSHCAEVNIVQDSRNIKFKRFT